MPYLLNLGYLLALVLLSPWLLYKSFTTGKYRRGLWTKLSGAITLSPAQPRIWFHGVSVGEIHLLRTLVAAFRRRHPGWHCVISTTTDTGYDEACKHFADVPVMYWPFDFTWAVRRAIGVVDPQLIVLAEGELWPNFLLEAERRGIAVAVVNGRLSPRSFGRYAWLQFLFHRLLSTVDLFAVQTEEYARRFRDVGAPASRIRVTGSVKYDGVSFERGNAKTSKLAKLLGVEPGQLIWIAGSTQPPEEEMAVAIYRRLRTDFPPLRLFIVPRQKDRFDEVANLLQRSGVPWLRRSQLDAPLADPSAIVLVDTIGELSVLWGLADVAFVGGSLDGKRGGQNMIEPAGYGAAVLFGPHVWNFQETVDRLLEARGAIQVDGAEQLETTLRRLLVAPEGRQQLGDAARRFVSAQQGATERTLDLLDGLMVEDASEPMRRAG